MKWDRKSCGTYPKWFATFVKRIVKFCFGKKVQFVFRGRGKRIIQDIHYNRDLPVRYASKVAVYVTIL